MSVFSQKNIIGKTPCRTVMHQLPYEAQPSTLRPPPTRWKRPHKAFHFHISYLRAFHRLHRTLTLTPYHPLVNQVFVVALLFALYHFNKARSGQGKREEAK